MVQLLFKKIRFSLCSHFSNLLHSQSYNLGGSEKEDRDRMLLLETRKPHLELWATGGLQNGDFVSYRILLAQLPLLSLVGWMGFVVSNTFA